MILNDPAEYQRRETRGRLSIRTKQLKADIISTVDPELA